MSQWALKGHFIHYTIAMLMICSYIQSHRRAYNASEPNGTKIVDFHSAGYKGGNSIDSSISTDHTQKKNSK